MVENYTVCNCMKVNYSDIVDVLHTKEKFDDVLTAFNDVQAATKCSTGCGGCYQKVLDIVSDVMHGKN